MLILVGPALHYGQEEAEAISEKWAHGKLAHGKWAGGVRVLQGDDANVAAAKASMNDADVVHIAAHGIFRGDNPLLSSIRLSDGPITGDELARATQTCRLVVLSCCDTGMADPAVPASASA